MPPPTTGQRLNDLKILQILSDLDYSVEQVNFRFTSKKILSCIVSITYFLYNEIKLFFVSLKKIAYSDLIYLPIHQSLIGLLRYAPYLITIIILNKKYTIRLEGSTIVNTYEKSSFIVKSLLKIIFNSAEKVIHLSQFTRNSEPFVQFSNNITLSNTHSLSAVTVKKSNKDRSQANLLYLSQISVSKGIVDLLKCCKILDDSGLRFKLNIAGSYSNDIYTTCRYYHNLMPDKIEFHGLVHGHSKRELLEKSDIFVLPSRLMEGQPLSIIEAMATGNAVVSTHVGGVVDIIQNEVNGYLVEPTNVPQLAKAIKTLVTDKVILNRMKDKNISHSSKYSEAKFHHNIKSLFDSMLKS